MRKDDFFYLSEDGYHQVHAIRWIPDGSVKAVLQLTHGMKEYIDRYDDFARYLTQDGWLVTGQDHLGHGLTGSHGCYGFFHEQKGNHCLLSDMHTLQSMTMQAYPDMPYFILGHSMGSFLVRQYIGMAGDKLQGAIIMGTGQQPAFLLKLAELLLNLAIKWKGAYATCHRLDAAMSVIFNRRIHPVQSAADWISNDPNQVYQYLSHPWCTFDFTFSAYRDLVISMEKMNQQATLQGIPLSLPVLLVSGKEDPVGNYGKGVEAVYQLYHKLGLQDLQQILYPSDRHEILNETDKAVVYQDILKWLNSKKERRN